MNYPQVYLVIHKDFEIPSLETLKAWAQPCQEIYVPDIKITDTELNSNISAIFNLHQSVTAQSTENLQIIVLNCHQIPEFLWLAIGSQFVEIYWIDDQAIAYQIDDVVEALDLAEQFSLCIQAAQQSYFGLIASLKSITDSSHWLDDSVDKFFAARKSEELTIAEAAIKKIATNVTRAGKRLRLDLK